jgi:cyclic pyranopterin phosphate synthase
MANAISVSRVGGIVTLLANGKMRLIVTAKCNLDCFYCHNEGQEKDDSFLELDVISSIARSFGQAGVRANEVTISGGEPLLHDRLADIVTVAASFSDAVTMVSNGLLADQRRLAPLVSAGLRKLRLGVDSLRTRKPRPSKGYLESPFHVADVLDQAVQLGLDVDMNVVITRFNRRELGQLAVFAVEHGLSIKFFEHVDVDEFGGGGSGGVMLSRPHVKFDEFAQELESSIGSTISFAESDQFGESNVRCFVGGSEIRYCRYLCDYRLCWLTGTRVDASGYVYNCMVNRGIDRLALPSDDAAAILDTLRVASERPCRSSNTDRETSMR